MEFSREIGARSEAVKGRLTSVTHPVCSVAFLHEAWRLNEHHQQKDVNSSQSVCLCTVKTPARLYTYLNITNVTTLYLFLDAQFGFPPYILLYIYIQAQDRSRKEKIQGVKRLDLRDIVLVGAFGRFKKTPVTIVTWLNRQRITIRQTLDHCWDAKERVSSTNPLPSCPPAAEIPPPDAGGWWDIKSSQSLHLALLAQYFLGAPSQHAHHGGSTQYPSMSWDLTEHLKWHKLSEMIVVSCLYFVSTPAVVWRLPWLVYVVTMVIQPPPSNRPPRRCPTSKRLSV